MDLQLEKYKTISLLFYATMEFEAAKIQTMGYFPKWKRQLIDIVA
jgi:hypothetical protein